MEIEEEPLLPLVRNRKTKHAKDVKMKRAANYQELKSTELKEDDISSKLPYGGKVYLKRQKKPDHYYIIIFEVLNMFSISKLIYSGISLDCCLLSSVSLLFLFGDS